MRLSIVGRTLTSAQDVMASMMLEDDRYVDGHLLVQRCGCQDFIPSASTMSEFPLTDTPSYGWIMVGCTHKTRAHVHTSQRWKNCEGCVRQGKADAQGSVTDLRVCDRSVSHSASYTLVSVADRRFEFGPMRKNLQQT